MIGATPNANSGSMGGITFAGSALSMKHVGITSWPSGFWSSSTFTELYPIDQASLTAQHFSFKSLCLSAVIAAVYPASTAWS